MFKVIMYILLEDIKSIVEFQKADTRDMICARSLTWFSQRQTTDGKPGISFYNQVFELHKHTRRRDLYTFRVSVVSSSGNLELQPRSWRYKDVLAPDTCLVTQRQYQIERIISEMNTQYKCWGQRP